MTTYKALKGKKIKFLASDPPGAAGEGQVWYNGGDFKTTSRLLAWGAGGNLNKQKNIMVLLGQSKMIWEPQDIILDLQEHKQQH